MTKFFKLLAEGLMISLASIIVLMAGFLTVGIFGALLHWPPAVVFMMASAVMTVLAQNFYQEHVESHRFMRGSEDAA